MLLQQAFDDCTTLGSTFKLLESFEGLLERDVIAADVAKKHHDLLRAFAQDMKEVQDLFDSHKAHPLLNKNSAPHSGRDSSSHRLGLLKTGASKGQRVPTHASLISAAVTRIVASASLLPCFQ